jgi:glycosyltransferase involved in cell wall biosynthesis
MADKKIILFFGIIRDYKGLDLLLEAMAFLSDDFQLIVAGEVYGSFQKYQEIIDNRQLNERVSLFTNYIGDDEVKDYFSAADVCVLPYKSATQSGITSISNHFELPLIATNVGGLAETIHHQKTGLIIEELAVKDIAESINHYFEANLKAQFEAAIKLQNLDNTWKNFAEKIVRFYHDLN